MFEVGSHPAMKLLCVSVWPFVFLSPSLPLLEVQSLAKLSEHQPGLVCMRKKNYHERKTIEVPQQS